MSGDPVISEEIILTGEPLTNAVMTDSVPVARPISALPARRPTASAWCRPDDVVHHVRDSGVFFAVAGRVTRANTNGTMGESTGARTKKTSADCPRLLANIATRMERSTHAAFSMLVVPFLRSGWDGGRSCHPDSGDGPTGRRRRKPGR